WRPPGPIRSSGAEATLPIAPDSSARMSPPGRAFSTSSIQLAARTGVQHPASLRSVTVRMLAGSGAGAEEPDDGVPDGVRDLLLVPRDGRRLRHAGLQEPHRALPPPEDLARRHVVDDEQVAALAGELGPRVVQ